MATLLHFVHVGFSSKGPGHHSTALVCNSLDFHRNATAEGSWNKMAFRPQVIQTVLNPLVHFGELKDLEMLLFLAG